MLPFVFSSSQMAPGVGSKLPLKHRAEMSVISPPDAKRGPAGTSWLLEDWRELLQMGPFRAPRPRPPARAVSTSLGYNERNTKRTGPPPFYEATVVGALLGVTDYLIRERAPFS